MALRVLVVEDDIDIQGYCKTILEAEGFAVDACSHAAEARRLFNANRPDMAVVDIGLPDGDGLELMKEWHAYPGAKVPMLFLTARGDLKTRLECFQKGAQDYVHKPFAAEELLARVKVHLQVKKEHEELVRRNYELELIGRARRDMTDMIVHDLKAPLTAIKGTLELIHARGLISQQNYSCLLQNAGSAADFMLLMLNDMLDLAQAGQTGLKVDIQPLDPAGLFKKIESLFSGQTRLRSKKLQLRVAPSIGRVTGDQNLLYRVLANLISNALKATPASGTVEVVCEGRGKSARFSVLDDGPGVPDSEKKKIFEKYATTGRGAASVETGTGIGLAFCEAAISAHKGKIWVEDRPTGGSKFIFEIPQPS